MPALFSSCSRNLRSARCRYFVPLRGPALFPEHLGSRVLAIVGVWRSCNWLDGSPERRLTMRRRFTAGSYRGDLQQNPSDPVISESYRGSEHALPDPKNCMIAVRANEVATSIDSRRLL